MEGIKHFSHKHPLVLSKYNNSPRDALCSACDNPILINTHVYSCVHQSVSSQDSPCFSFSVHKTCADLPIIIQHHLHPQHVLTLVSSYAAASTLWCEPCQKSVAKWVYKCTSCWIQVCIKCVFLERQLNHPSHNHTLTLLPLKATLHTCAACGTQGSQDFSYLCQTCLFWIHKSCASAPAQLIRKDHHSDHPLVLAYSMPEDYQELGVSCSLCPQTVHFVYWIYYCAECRYFAHVHCALSAAESGNENNDEGDVEGSNLVHFPISDDEPDLLYQLIQQFAEQLSISTDEKSEKADMPSKCLNGHSLILFDDFNNKSVVETNTSDKRICDGCVQPLLPPPNPFYGCLDCNFFLHSVCAAELPREIQRASQYPKNKLIRLTGCYQTSKQLKFFRCNLCERYCSGLLYYNESYGYWIDIVCAALPSKIKHDSHRHTLHQLSDTCTAKCRGCGSYKSASFFGCKICDHYICRRCALKRGTIKHRWDEHKLSLMHPPVKGHPHAFDCELCSEDINPNYWFYHCQKCDTSFHSRCIDQDQYSNIKYGGIVRDDTMHEHSLQLTGTRDKFKCDHCGQHRSGYYSYNWKPRLLCVPCNFSVCISCILTSYWFRHQVN